MNNEDFRRLLDASRQKSPPAIQSDADRPNLSKRGILTPQSTLFSRATLSEDIHSGSSKKASKKQTYRDRASERRSGKEVDETEVVVSARKGLDFELLKRARRGEDILGLFNNESGEDDEETVTEDPELDNELEELLKDRDAVNDIAEKRIVVKSKAQLLDELRKWNQEQKSKRKFKPIGRKSLSPPPKSSRKKNLNSNVSKQKSHGSKQIKSNLQDEKTKNTAEEKKDSTKTPRPIVDNISSSTVNVPLEQADRNGTIYPKMAYKILPDTTSKERKPGSEEQNKVISSVSMNGDDENYENDDDSDIFGDAGTDYDPLAGIDDSDHTESSESDGEVKEKKKNHISKQKSPSVSEIKQSTKRNYFSGNLIRSPERQGSDKLTQGYNDSTSENSRAVTKSAMDLVAEADLDSVLAQVRAKKNDRSSTLRQQGLVPLQAFGGDYDIDTDLGVEGRWIDEDEEDYIGRKIKKRKR
ncbi:hypothetical protein V1511DRAFT_495416 [Dipodascopsis uninucleata]